MKRLVLPSFDTPLVSFVLASPRGATLDPAGREGLLSHCTELSRRGAGDRDRETIDELVDSLGATLEVVLNPDYFYVSGQCLERHLDTVFDLAIDILERPRFDEEEHERLMREALNDLEELRDEDPTLCHRFFNLYAHPGHPYARTVLGTEQSIASITLAESREWFSRLFIEPEAFFGVAGASDEARAASLAQKLEGIGARNPVAAPDLHVPPAPAGRQLILVDKPDRNQCSLLLGHVAPLAGTREYDALRIAETAFGGMFSARLTQEIRVRQGWSYDAHCALYQGRAPGWWQLSMSPTAAASGAALARALEMFEELVDHGLSALEHEFAVGHLSGSEAFARATARQRLHRAMRDAMMGRPEGFSDGFVERIQGIDCDEVNDAVRRCLHPRQLTAVMVATAAQSLDSLPRDAFDRTEVVDYRSY